MNKRSNIKWTYKLLKNSASKYNSVKEWRTKESSAYATASMRGYLDQLTKGMIKIGEKGFWTKKRVKRSALKYKTKVDWIKNDDPAYRAAYKNGWIDEITKHMIPIGNRKMRCVYSISIKGKKIIYIGLTGYYQRRIRDHFQTRRLLDLIKEYGKKSIITKQLTKYIIAEEAIKIERQLTQNYKKKNYQVLNISKPGSLGGTTIIWTKEKILKDAKKYKSIREWLKNNKNSYAAAWSMKIIDQATKHMTRLWEKKWTEKKVIKAALKFKSFKDWLNKDPASYRAAQARKLLDDSRITKNLIKISGSTIHKWTKNKVLKDSKKYNSRSEWRINSPTAYKAARERGYFLEAVTHMKKPPPHGIWTKENIIKNAKKYSTIKAWMKNNPGAYSAAIKKKILNKSTSHMTRLWVEKWNKKTVLKSAKKFDLSSHWKKKYPSAPAAARRLGIYKKATRHMIDGRFRR